MVETQEYKETQVSLKYIWDNIKIIHQNLSKLRHSKTKHQTIWETENWKRIEFLNTTILFNETYNYFSCEIDELESKRSSYFIVEQDILLPDQPVMEMRYNFHSNDFQKISDVVKIMTPIFREFKICSISG